MGGQQMGGQQMGGQQMGGQRMGGSMAGSRGDSGSMGASSRGLGDAMERSTVRREEARARREAATAQRDSVTPEKAVFGLSTAARAKLLKDANFETRKAFGAFQASLAKANGDSERAARINAESATHAQLASFGSDTAAHARTLQSADLATRKAFGRFQSASAREQDLRRVAGPEAVGRAFGAQTAANAQLQRDGTAESRTSFGENQSARAKAAFGDKDADGDD